MISKFYSVRVRSYYEISPKATLITCFDGSEDIIPNSQIAGNDYDVSKSDALWISEWILKQKKLQYTDKKSRNFYKSNGSWIMCNFETVEAVKHVPDIIENIDVSPINELKR